MRTIGMLGTDSRAARNFYPVIRERPVPVRLGPVAPYQQK